MSAAEEPDPDPVVAVKSGIGIVGPSEKLAIILAIRVGEGGQATDACVRRIERNVEMCKARAQKQKRVVFILTVLLPI